MTTDRHLQEQVDLIREVFLYNRKFKDSVFVIKIDDELIDHPHFSLLISDLALLHQNGIKIVIVPGAVKHIDAVMTGYGLEIQRAQGLRITTEEALPFVKMAAFDICNKIMTLLSGHGVNALIGNWVNARALGVLDGTDFYFTGQVSRIKTAQINRILAEGDIPIFPTIGWNANGDAYNVSSDELALFISRELKAAKLFYLLIDDPLMVNGHFEDSEIPEENIINGRISRLSVQQARDLMENSPDFRLKKIIRNGILACESGVERVHIADARIDGVVLKEIYSNVGSGTMIFASDFDQIRNMHRTDIDGVLHLMRPLVESGNLIPRSRKFLEERCGEFVVYESDGILHGCAAFHPYTPETGEIAALAVDAQRQAAGTGRKMVSYLIEKARKEKYKQVFVLTTQTIDWFLLLGFRQGKLEELPEAKRAKYDKSRNSKILIMDL